MLKKKDTKQPILVSLSISQLVKAVWNYKEDDKDLLKKLVNNIKKNGQIETILVREISKDVYEIVNGNHRLDAFKLAGLKTIQAYNLGKIDIAYAKRLAIELNETRFATNAEKMSTLISELLKIYTKDDLLNTLPYSADEIDKMISNFQIPLDNKSIDELSMQQTENECPKCGFKW